MPDVPACFPTSQELHKKEENFYSYTTFAKHVENLNITIPTTTSDGQTPSKIYVEQLVFKGQDQLKQLIENLTRDVIANIHHNGTFITQECAARGETGPIELDPSSSRSNGSNHPEVIEKAILVNEIKESTGKKHHA